MIHGLSTLKQHSLYKVEDDNNIITTIITVADISITPYAIKPRNYKFTSYSMCNSYY